MRWQERVFGPMLERTMENAQAQRLAQRYDLSPDSRLARVIVRYTNEVLDAEERRRQVKRVRPGEMLYRTGRGHIVLPLRTEEDIGRLVQGEKWLSVREDILRRCKARYLELFPEASPERVARFLRTIWYGKSPRSPRGQGSPLHGPRKERPWEEEPETPGPVVELDVQRATRWMERKPPRPGHLEETFRDLAHFLGTEAGVPPAIQEPMILDLMSLRARFCPRLRTLGSGQMPLAAMHVETGRRLWQMTRHQPLAPIVVTLLDQDEVRILRNGGFGSYDELLELYGRRIARVLAEAYKQDGLLSFAELQWVFLTSAETVSRAVDHYQRKNRVILPCPGTVLDMGRMLTHKDLVVRLHLQGLSVLEIARQTYHSPGSVDAYLKTFDSVLILRLYGLPPRLMAGVLGRGEYLIHEYLDLIQSYVKEPETVRQYLREHGVSLPSNVSSTG